MKRVAIYFFYDADGIVDDYVFFFLEELKKNVNRIVFVSNGLLEKQSKEKLSKTYPEIIERENKGLDAWAYKTALEYIGWDALREYDEVILSNFTVFGPIFPFSEMFDKMDSKDLDFWGITLHRGANHDPFDANPYGYLPEHVQSSFMVFRKRFLNDPVLKNYWDNLPEIKDYNDSVGKHESYFTKFFSDQGYKYDLYVNTTVEEELSPYMLIDEPVYVFEKYRCPIVKRKSFFIEKDHLLEVSAGEQNRELYRYLIEKTHYNYDFILENIIRTTHPCDFVNAMGLVYVLPRNIRIKTDCEIAAKGLRVALCMHLFYEDLLLESYRYASSMPKEADIFITTSSSDFAEKIKSLFAQLPNKIEIRMIENRGRDVSALLVGCADIPSKYDLFCFFHDKKTTQVEIRSAGYSFAYKTYENVLASKEYVENVVSTFIDNPKLGLLSPTIPIHSVFNFAPANEWGLNFKNTRALIKDFKLNVPIAENKFPVAPHGSCFWARSAAVNTLFARGWSYTDFPKEPLGPDGTISHAIERAYPFFAQAAGYYPAYVLTDEYAGLEITNLYHYYRKFNEIMTRHYPIYGTYLNKMFVLDNALMLSKAEAPKRSFKAFLAKILPRKLYKFGGKIYRKLRRV